MEQEIFLTGYCRGVDQSRMVAVITDDNTVTEIDCCYGTCPHEQSCPIARQIRELTP